YAFITPTDAKNQLFICPYAVDPDNEDIMYYPTANEIWRNNQLGSIPNGTQRTMQGWSKIAAVNVPQGYMISTLSVSKNNPSSILYYALSAYQGTPKIFKLPNAQTAADGIQEISIPGAAQGAYVHNIAVNPDDGNEIMVVMSNYNIVGVYHSSDGGKTYTAIEGNLEGDKDNPGPSLRCASILPTDKGKVYLLATSIGLFSAATLNGTGTQWVQESPSDIGNTVIDFIASRKSDGRVVAATHGRGVFISTGTGTKALASVNVSSLKIQAKPGATASTSFILQNKGSADLNYNITLTGQAKEGPGTTGKEFKGKVPETGVYQMNNALSLKPYDKNKVMKSDDSERLTGTDILMLDDGNNVPEVFYGYGMGSGFSYANEFNLSGFDFKLDAIQVYFRSEYSPLNGAGYAVLDDSLNIIYYGFMALEKSQNGMWFTLPIDTAFTFKDGHRFFLQVDVSNMADYPGGFDNNAKIKNKSYYVAMGTLQLINMNTVKGAENGAFLIRAVGTKVTGGTNKLPVPVATISTANAKTGQSITFDASGSYDPDGQIVSYLWNFGDGASSDQKVTTHSYSQPGTYKVTIKVTDNQGGTGQGEGQVNVTSGSTIKVTIDPLSGIIAPGSEKTIKVTMNAEGAAEGTYNVNLSINSNGGNITIPVELVVSNAVAVNEKNNNPPDYVLYQNYPNPFNPETVITFRIKEEGKVILKIYDINGKEISMPVNQFLKAGEHKIRFNAQKLSSGVYYYILTSDKFKDGRKMIVIK
ncbi:MAG: PKD domain-containing protein, partial [Syntrophothermus sp.]